MMRHLITQHTKWLTCLCVLLMSTAACGPDTSDGDGNRSNNADSPNNQNNTPDQRACNASADCNGGEICRDERCREACAEGDPCQTAALPVCDTDLGYCIGCTQDADCGDGMACAPETGRCLELETCNSDDDCAGGQRCRDGACTNIDDTSCQPNQVTCDGNVVLLCSPDGTSQERIPCGDGEQCQPEGDGARCASQVCEPNEIGCLDNNTAFVCDAEGIAQTALPCREGQFCQAGTCRQELCAPGAVTCDGDNRLQCNEDGTGQEVTSCNDNCNAEEGCTCVDGSCTERTCIPGDARCVGNAAQACNSQGTGYQPPVDCGDGICLEGLCVEAECSPGDSLCAGNTILTCNNQGTGYQESTCGDQVCLETNGDARCGEPVCQPSQTRCDNTGEAVLRCDARGTEETREPCAQGRFCQQGVCLEGLCDPNDNPICIEGDVFTCNERGSDYILADTCTRNELCRDGQCEQRLCTPLSARCDGSTLVECSADGLSENRQNCGAEGLVCDDQNGRCIEVSACNPTPQCNGNNPILNEDTCQCVQCLRNDDCGNGLACVQKQCVQAQGVCNSGNDCPQAAPLCIDQRCVDCLNDSQCANSADGPVCTEGTCGPCECPGLQICNDDGACFDPNNCNTDIECQLGGVNGRCDQDSNECYTPGLCDGGGGVFPDPFEAGCPSGLTCAPVFQNIALSCTGCTGNEDCREGEICVEDLYISGLFFCSTNAF